MRSRALLLATCAVGVGLLALPPLSEETRASPNQVVPYQGRLTDSNGKPLEGTIGKLTFRIYNSATPSPASFVWGEAHLSVPVRRGVFSVNLGAGDLKVDSAGTETPGPNPLDSSVFDGGARFIEVQVNGDPPLAPLTRLGSVPFAISAGGSVPVGGIVDWYRPDTSTPVPAGWVVCDGQPINDPDSRFNGQNAPNLINRFSRGLDPALLSQYGGGALPDTGGAETQPLAHSHQVDNHSHSLNNHTHGLGSHTHSMAHTHRILGQTQLGNQNAPLPSGPTFSYQGGLFLHYHDVDFPSQGSSAPNTGPASGTSDPASGNTGSRAPGTSSALGQTDNRPPFVGLLKIMRIK